jgi:hypothetical protein
MDDLDDEVWSGPVFGLDPSQETQGVHPDTLGKGMAEDPVLVDASQVSIEATGTGQENPVVNSPERDIETAATQEAVDDEDGAQKPKAKRNYISYANKKILGSMDLFLETLCIKISSMIQV